MVSIFILVKVMKKNKKELLGLRLKEYRENRKLTQDKLAEMVGIDPKHLSRIENGRNYPSLETLEKILDSLDVSYEEIFNFKLLALPPMSVMVFAPAVLCQIFTAPSSKVAHRGA